MPPEWLPFIRAVSDAYTQADDDRRMLERSLELTSQELLGANSAMRAMYERLIYSSPDGIFAFDHDLACIVWNPGMEALSGVPQTEALGKPVLKCLAAMGFDDCETLVRVLDGENRTLAEREYRRGGSEPGANRRGRFMAGQFSPLRDESGQIIGGLGLLRDITQSKQVAQEFQERLRESLLLNRVIAAATSTLDLNETLQKIMIELAQALDLPQGGVALFSTDRTHLTVVADYHPEGHSSALGEAIPVANNPSTQYVLEHRAPLAVSDVQTDERFAVINELMQMRGVASMVLVPLIVRDEIVGTLGLDSYTRREFTPREIELIQNVAAAASQVLDNARLFSDLQHEREYLIIANDAGRRLTSEMSITGVMDAVLALAPRLGATHGYLLVCEGTEPIYFRTTYAAQELESREGALTFAQHLLEEGLEQDLLQTREAVVVPDTHADPRWFAAPEVAHREPARSVVAVPFFGTRSNLCGVLGYTHIHPYALEQLTPAVVELIARYLATALENARLFEQTQAALAARERIEQERLALERKMLEAQKLESLGILAGGIAHDFNNLLVGMMGSAGMALMELNPQAPARRHVEQIETAARRAADLTRQMLAYSGKGHFVIQPLDLNQVATEMVQLLHAAISKKAALRLALSDDLPTISGDSTQLRQVVMNLITNASDALAGREGTITLSTGIAFATHEDLSLSYTVTDLPEGDYVWLQVSDTGVGMDAETQARMFEPFFTTKFTGRGLGLAAVVGIMRGHHGAILVTSAPNQGTTFRLLFPLAAGAHSVDSPVSRRVSEHHQETILIVDDEQMVREITADMCKYFGYRVLVAENGARALDLYRSRMDSVDCILLDLTMPGMSGEETLRAVRQYKPSARVILMSGYSEQEVISRFNGEAPQAFVQKPYTPDELRDKLAQVMHGM